VISVSKVSNRRRFFFSFFFLLMLRCYRSDSFTGCARTGPVIQSVGLAFFSLSLSAKIVPLVETLKLLHVYSLGVALHVEREVVRAREAPVAVSTLERFGARVFPVVARQLVGSREPPLAPLPRAPVRLLSCNTHTKLLITFQNHKHTNTS
jgi:hypothetical protein